MGSSKNRLRERKMSRPNGMASPLSDLSAFFLDRRFFLVVWRKSKRDIYKKTVVRLPARRFALAGGRSPSK